MGEWRTVRLRDICDSVDYGLTARASADPVGPKFLRITDIVGESFDWSNVPFVKATPEQIEKYRIHSGDIVIARTGATTGYSKWISNPPDAVFASYLIRLKVSSDVDSRFVGYLLKSDQFWSYMKGVLGDKSAQPNASATTITDAPLRIPAEKSQQQAIARVLGALDDKIAVNERIATTVDRLAEAEYVRSTGKATETVLLGDLLDLKYGKALPATSRSPGDVPVYGSGGIVGMHNQHLVDGPGIVVGRKGTVGAVHWSQQKFFPIDTTFYVEVRRPDVPMEFLFFMLRKLGLDSMNSDSAVPGLNRANALALKTHLPQQDELARFADKIRPLFELKHSLSVQSNCLKELRDTLLPKLMSGELRVRDAEKAVEEAL